MRYAMLCALCPCREALPVPETLCLCPGCSACVRDALPVLGYPACARIPCLCQDVLPVLGMFCPCQDAVCPCWEALPVAQGCSGPCFISLRQQEFSHPVESLALTVEEMINVRRVLVKAEMEKFLQSKELYSSLRKGKVGAGARGAEGRPPGPRLSPLFVCRSAAAAGPSSPSSRGLQRASSASGERRTVPRGWEGGRRVPTVARGCLPWPCSPASLCVPRSVCSSCSLKVRDRLRLVLLSPCPLPAPSPSLSPSHPDAHTPGR